MRIRVFWVHDEPKEEKWNVDLLGVSIFLHLAIFLSVCFTSREMLGNASDGEVDEISDEFAWSCVWEVSQNRAYLKKRNLKCIHYGILASSRMLSLFCKKRVPGVAYALPGTAMAPPLKDTTMAETIAPPSEDVTMIVAPLSKDVAMTRALLQCLFYTRAGDPKVSFY